MATKIKKFLTNKKKLKCYGCDRHEKEVSAETNLWFCNHCITDNGNYNRYKSGLPLIKPLEHIKANDIVLDCNGKPYLIIEKSNTLNEDNYYFCEQLFGKHEVVEIGDYCLYKKTGKREVNKINKAVDSGSNFSDFIHENKNSCLKCKYVNKTTNSCDKKEISLLDEKADATTCEFFK